MLNSSTHDKLSALRLHEMAHAWFGDAIPA